MVEQRTPVWNGPAPKPRDASIAAQRLIELASLVPSGQWVSYGDLADAYVARHQENMVARGVASALSLSPVASAAEERELDDPQPRVDRWHIPWHRIRLADGRAISRKYGLLSADDHVNRMFVSEGGTLRHGAATDACRFDILKAVRSGSPPAQIDLGAVRASAPKPELSEAQKARMAERARERHYRMGG